MKCKDCKWWGSPSWTEEFVKRRHLPEMRDCQVPKPKFLAFGEGVEMEGVATQADFGCVQFEPIGKGTAPKEMWTRGL